MYTAAVLTPMSADLCRWVARAVSEDELNKFQFETPQGETIPHHMTINLGKFDLGLNPEFILGHRATLLVDQLRWSQEIGSCAFRVISAISEIDDHKIISINDGRSSKHITACLKPGVKAYKSNDLFGEKAESDLGSSIQYSKLYDETIRLEAVVMMVE